MLTIPFVIPVRVEGTDWAAWITAIATWVIAGFACFAFYNLIDAKRTRHSQLVTDLSRRWDEGPALRALELMQHYRSSGLRDLIEETARMPNPTDQAAVKAFEAKLKELAAVSVWVNLAETIGVLYSEKAISEEVIYKMWGPSIVSAWAFWAPAVLRARELSGQSAYRYFEKLAAKMEELEAREKRREANSAVLQPMRGSTPTDAEESGSPDAEAATDKNESSQSSPG